MPTAGDDKAEALFEQACSVEMSNFNPFATGLAFEKIIKKHQGQEADEAKVKQLRAMLDEKLDAYEVILSKQAYLAGDNITLADLFHLPYGTIVEKLGADPFSVRPNVRRWWKDISSRAAWLAVKDSA